MKRAAVAAMIGLSMFGLTACGTYSNHTFNGGTKGIIESVPDGRIVACVVYGDHGISCDWEHVK